MQRQTPFKPYPKKVKRIGNIQLLQQKLDEKLTRQCLN